MRSARRADWAATLKACDVKKQVPEWLSAGGEADQRKAKHETPGIIAVMGCNRA